MFRKRRQRTPHGSYSCAILKSMTQEKAVSHWQKRSRAELKTARVIFEQNDPELYGEVLFHCHLALELALKAKYIGKYHAPAPYSHDLNELAAALEESWSGKERIAFEELTDYAILARYGDEQWFTSHATKEKAKEWLQKTQQFLSKIQQ